MTLRVKALLIVGLTLVALILVLYVVSLLILQHSYLQLEKDAAESNIQRVLNTISGDLDNLDSTTVDWAYWDETYSFVQGENDTYVEDNLAPATLVNLRINMMLFFDTSGGLIHSVSMDLQSEEELPLSQDIADYITPESPLLAHDGVDSRLTGAFHVSEGTVLFASRPILTNKLEGPIQGTLVLGYYLDAARIGVLSDTLNLSIASYSLDDAHLPDDVKAANLALSDADSILQPINNDVISGYTTIKDVEGDPVLILRVDMPRDIYKQGQRSLLYFGISLLILGIASVITVLWLVERVILSRLTALSDSVATVRDTGELSVPIAVAGKDELSSLASGVKGMLTDLAQSRDTLQRTNRELEDRVEERTVALSKANEQLEQEVVERRQAQLELAQARDQALDALRLKTQILANVSHDARTPLTVIMLMVEGFRTGRYGEVTEKQNIALDRISLSAQELLNFISNILESSKLEHNNRIKPVNRAFHPQNLLNEVASIMKPLADRKGLRFEAQSAESIGDTLYGDENRLKQILSNLATNAVKFTREGTVKVSIYMLNTGHWALEVSDTGIGLSAEDQLHIFEAFWQVDSSMTREADRGIGLGLSIVRELTMLMDGEVKLQSEIGKGSTFTVILPLVQPGETQKETTYV